MTKYDVVDPSQHCFRWNHLFQCHTLNPVAFTLVLFRRKSLWKLHIKTSTTSPGVNESMTFETTCLWHSGYQTNNDATSVRLFMENVNPILVKGLSVRNVHWRRCSRVEVRQHSDCVCASSGPTSLSPFVSVFVDVGICTFLSHPVFW